MIKEVRKSKNHQSLKTARYHRDGALVLTKRHFPLSPLVINEWLRFGLESKGARTTSLHSLIGVLKKKIASSARGLVMVFVTKLRLVTLSEERRRFIRHNASQAHNQHTIYS